MRTVDDARRGLALHAAERLWRGVLETASVDALECSSGCGDWSNRDLIDHVIGGAERYRMLLDGAVEADVARTRGKDYVGERGLDSYDDYERALLEAVERADPEVMVDHRLGPRSGASLVNMRIMELVLHAADLCSGLSIEWNPTAELADYVRLECGAIIEDLRDAGTFAPARSPTSDDPGELLQAFAGRR
nr:maleylpyruvate isomerase N-terminal domain-containing protein [Gordonia zhaorongruii]